MKVKAASLPSLSPALSAMRDLCFGYEVQALVVCSNSFLLCLGPHSTCSDGRRPSEELGAMGGDDSSDIFNPDEDADVFSFQEPSSRSVKAKCVLEVMKRSCSNKGQGKLEVVVIDRVYPVIENLEKS